MLVQPPAYHNYEKIDLPTYYEINMYIYSILNSSIMKLLKHMTKPKLSFKRYCAQLAPHPMYTVKEWYPEHTNCGFCGGTEHMESFPHCCAKCFQITYKNPVPVAVGLLPFQVNNRWGLLLTKRSIKPHIGGLCLPGGFINWGESWSQAVSREVLEETGIETDPDEYIMKAIHSTPDNKRVLIFAYSKKTRYVDDIKGFVPTDETSELVVGHFGEKLCFSLHQEVFDGWLPRE